MKDFNKLLKTHKDFIYSLAEKNTPRNENGDAVITKEDSWFYEDEWDDYYKELSAVAGNSSTGSVVR